MGLLLRILVCLAALAVPCVAQTAGTTTIDLVRELQVDVPAGWVRGDPRIVGQAFANAMGRSVEEAIHPSGSRVTDRPYGVVDLSSPYVGVPSVAMQNDWAAKLAEGYASAIGPPSKSDRPPSWKKSKVSSIRHDYVNSRFEFDATITYDFIGDLHVRVAGVFNADHFGVLTLWSDAAYDDRHAAELTAIQRSFRFGPGAAPPVSMTEVFLSRTRWVMGFVIAGVVALQIWVLVRERRERRAAGVA
jgi:hypothetical protein